MKSELERTKEALSVAMEQLGGAARCTLAVGTTHAASAGSALAVIRAILNPPPEMETVEVESYATVWPDKSICSLMVQPPRVMEASQALVKLTGTYQRAKKQPVERSVSVEASVSNDTGQTRIQDGAWLFANRKDARGKTGTLTFVWQEEQ